jgi:cytochrome c553
LIVDLRLYLDDATAPFREIVNGDRVAIDTTDLADGPHRLRVETVEGGSVTGCREVRFTVRNGPGIAVAGLDDGDEIRGQINLIVNASDAGIDGKFDVHAFETHRGLPFWMGGFALVVILTCAAYLATDPFRHRSYERLAAEVASLSGSSTELPAPPVPGADTSAHPVAAGVGDGPLAEDAYLPLTVLAGSGDPVRGGTLYAARCSGCHGAGGEGTVREQVTLGSDGIYPRLAGQNRAYIMRQLDSFADGWRDNTVMKPMAQSLDAQARLDVASYVERLAPPYPPRVPVDPALLRQGEAIARDGVAAKSVVHCAGCHGPDGEGAGAVAPWLSGQNAEYLAAQLAHWRDGTRTNDWLQLMRPVALGLSDAEARAVAAYYSDNRPGYGAGEQP